MEIVENRYEETYPEFISMEKYEDDIEEKEIEIEDLLDSLKQMDDELVESKKIIEKLLEELKGYEKIFKRNNISL